MALHGWLLTLLPDQLLQGFAYLLQWLLCERLTAFRIAAGDFQEETERWNQAKLFPCSQPSGARGCGWMDNTPRLCGASQDTPRSTSHPGSKPQPLRLEPVCSWMRSQFLGNAALCPACPSVSGVWALTGGWVVGLEQGPAMDGGWTPPEALQTHQIGSSWLPNTDLGLPVGNLTLVSLSQALSGLMLQNPDPTAPHTEALLQCTQHGGPASHRA